MVVTTGHTDMDTGDERRGKLKLSPQLQLMPMLKLTLILGIATMDMVWDTTATIADHTMVVTTGHTDMDTDTGDERRGKLRLSPQLQLMPILKLTLILGIATMDMVLDMATIADHTMVATTDHTDMVMDTGEERRGKLRLNQKLTQRLMLIHGTVPMDMVQVTMDMAMDTTDHMDMDTEAMDIGARMPRLSNQN